MYKVEHNAYGSTSRYKARLVAEVYAHTYDIDNKETFGHVANMTIVCAIIVIVFLKGWLLH